VLPCWWCCLLPSFLPSWRRGLLALSLLIAGFLWRGPRRSVRGSGQPWTLPPPATAAALLFGVARAPRRSSGKAAVRWAITYRICAGELLMQWRARRQLRWDSSFAGHRRRHRGGEPRGGGASSALRSRADDRARPIKPFPARCHGTRNKHASATRAASREDRASLGWYGQRIAIEQAVQPPRGFPPGGHQARRRPAQQRGLSFITFRDVNRAPARRSWRCERA